MPLTLNVKNVLQRNILPKDCSKPKRHMTSYLVTIATDYHETSSKVSKKKKTASREVSKGKTFCFKKARKLRKLVGEATAVVPFLNARCNFCRQWENVWPVIGVFLLNRKKIATQGRRRTFLIVISLPYLYTITPTNQKFRKNLAHKLSFVTDTSIKDDPSSLHNF